MNLEVEIKTLLYLLNSITYYIVDFKEGYIKFFSYDYDDLIIGESLSDKDGDALLQILEPELYKLL